MQPTASAVVSVIRKTKPRGGDRNEPQEHISAIYANVEERPFQGRVTKERRRLQHRWSPWRFHWG